MGYMCDKHSQAFTDMMALANAVVAAHDDMFNQCFSNPIKTAWGQPINLTKSNEAYRMAYRILAARKEMGE